MKVVLVCTGNTCRSPMAEALLRQMAASRGLEIEVSSAGTHASPGLPASPEAVEVCRRAGIDLTGHRSRRLSAAVVEQADLILTMEHHHRVLAAGLYPDAAGRLHALAAYAGESGAAGVPDPLGGGREVYQGVYERLASLLDQVLSRIREEDYARADRHRQ